MRVLRECVRVKASVATWSSSTGGHHALLHDQSLLMIPHDDAGQHGAARPVLLEPRVLSHSPRSDALLACYGLR